MGYSVTPAAFIGLCCLLVVHVHSSNFAKLLDLTSSQLDTAFKDATTASQTALKEAISTHTQLENANKELTKVELFRKAESVFEDLDAKIGELEWPWKKMKVEEFRLAKKALKEAGANSDTEAGANPNKEDVMKKLEEAATLLARIDGPYNNAELLLKYSNSHKWSKWATLAEMQDAEYVAGQAAKTAERQYWEAYLGAQSQPLKYSQELVKKKELEKKNAEQLLAGVQKVCKAKEVLDKWTKAVEDLKSQEPKREKLLTWGDTTYVRNTPEYIAWEKRCQPAKEKLDNASKQLRKEVDVLMKRSIFVS